MPPPIYEYLQILNINGSAESADIHNYLCLEREFMAYHLLNVETSEFYYCDDHVWIGAIDTAVKNDWVPDGTFFDIVYETNDQCFDTDDLGYWMFMFTVSRDKSLEWDGNYLEKSNQVVMYEDSIYLAIALDGTGVSIELIEFIRKGSFRICSE